MRTRNSAVAGRFYPENKAELEEMFARFEQREKNRVKIELSKNGIIGGIIPHAGYVYSGWQAYHFFEIIKNAECKFDTVFIICPNHTGLGSEIALDENEAWKTPLGSVEIDKDFNDMLPFSRSEKSHRYEHSAEVLLPFLQKYMPDGFKIVPICILQQNLKNAKLVATSIYEANLKLKKKILICASSDFSHFLSAEAGRQLDDLVVEPILNFNSEMVMQTVQRHQITVCGYAPIMCLIEYAKLVSDEPKIKILKRGHSGEVYESHEVVNYISFLVYE